jgi:hypothetical protein
LLLLLLLACAVVPVGGAGGTGVEASRSGESADRRVALAAKEHDAASASTDGEGELRPPDRTVAFSSLDRAVAFGTPDRASAFGSADRAPAVASEVTGRQNPGGADEDRCGRTGHHCVRAIVHAFVPRVVQAVAATLASAGPDTAGDTRVLLVPTARARPDLSRLCVLRT